jgi:NAD(P)-dependent dehydrogenase (short-subunit alcohol dehydrogenase family)
LRWIFERLTDRIYRIDKMDCGGGARMLRVLVTGANRGLGLEFTRQYLAEGARVFAGCRDPERAVALGELSAARPGRLAVLALDVTDEGTIDAAVAAVRAAVDGLDVLINNAGVFPRGERPGNLDAGTMLRTLHVNAVGPMMVAQRCLGLLKARDAPKIVNVSSQLGSLASKGSGGSYSYCSSKAALNMLTRALAFDLRDAGVVVVTVHPGWVQTDMGGGGARLTPTESVRGLRDLIARLTAADTGKFYTWQGREHPW